MGRRFPAARRLLERAREAASEPDLIARIDASPAYVSAEQGDLPGALAMCEAASSTRRSDVRDLGRPSQPTGPDPVPHGRRIAPRSGRASGTGSRCSARPGRGRQGAHEPRDGPSSDKGQASWRRPTSPVRSSCSNAPDTQSVPPWPSTTWVAPICCAATWCRRLRTWTRVRPILLPLSPVGVAILQPGPSRGPDGGGTHPPRAGGPRRGRSNVRQPPPPTAPGRGRADDRPCLARRETPNEPSSRREQRGHGSTASGHLPGGSRPRRWSTALRCGSGRTRPSLVPRGDDLAAELDALELRWWAIDIRLDTRAGRPAAR